MLGGGGGAATAALAVSYLSFSFYAVSYSVCERKIRHGTRGRSNAVPWSASWEVFIVGYPRSWESGLFIGHSLPSLSLFLHRHRHRHPSFFIVLHLSLSIPFSHLFLLLFRSPLSSGLSFHLTTLPLSPSLALYTIQTFCGITWVYRVSDLTTLIRFSRFPKRSFVFFLFSFSFFRIFPSGRYRQLCFVRLFHYARPFWLIACPTSLFPPFFVSFPRFRTWNRPRLGVWRITEQTLL